MSIENFCGKYPATLELKEIIQRRRVHRGSSGSAVCFLAEELAQAGGEGLRRISQKLDPQNVTIVPDLAEMLKNLPTQQDKKSLLDHSAAIIFGTAIVSIEEILASKELDIEAWYSRHNLQIAGTPFPKLKVPETKKEKVSDDQWRRMLSYVALDKTLAIFFNQGIDALPYSLRMVLLQTGMLNYIRASILPIYSERAKLLVG